MEFKVRRSKFEMYVFEIFFSEASLNMKEEHFEGGCIIFFDFIPPLEPG